MPLAEGWWRAMETLAISSRKYILDDEPLTSIEDRKEYVKLRKYKENDLKVSEGLDITNEHDICKPTTWAMNNGVLSGTTKAPQMGQREHKRIGMGVLAPIEHCPPKQRRKENRG